MTYVDNECVCQDVRRIVLTSPVPYDTGDVAYIWPPPAIDETRAMLIQLDIDVNVVVVVVVVVGVVVVVVV